MTSGGKITKYTSKTIPITTIRLEVPDSILAYNGALGFYGTAPVDQPATVADADGTLADATLKINTIIDRLQELGLIA